jgi:OmpA-OmpF porin, OOP family
MASKKYKLLLSILIFMGSSVFAQMDKSYDVKDSSVIPSKRLPQYNEFWNNQYNFPAKPRNMVEVGASLSTIGISGDVPSKYPVLPSFEVHVRKAIGYVFSLRLQYVRGIAEGLDWQPFDNYKYNTAWVQDPNFPGLTTGYKGVRIQAYTPVIAGSANTNVNQVFLNYKSLINDFSLQGIVTLNNIRFHKQKTGMTIYGGAGLGVTWYHVMVDAGRADGSNYSALFDSIISKYNTKGGFTYSNRNDILKDLKNGIDGIPGMDGVYESRAETENGRRPSAGDDFYTLKPSGTVIIGLAYKLGKRVNLQLEDRQTFVKTDLLDGQRWAEQVAGSPVLTSDFDSYNVLSLGLNFNLGGKAVEPLWWLNPLDYAYSELNNPRHTKFPKPKFDDADGDGVLDQLDREPNTPAGCPVDTHGVSLDTDGDGVPDCKDKQKITPTECQPVDADGVGKCPDPACCKMVLDSLSKMHGVGSTGNCPTDYPSLAFKGNGKGLSGDVKALLATVAAKLKASPDCKIAIAGYPGASKKEQAVCKTRNEAIVKYLVETLGISADRITNDCVVGGGDKNTVDIKTQ